MEYLFLLGRILYGGFFIQSGINHFRHMKMMAGYAGSKGVPAPKPAVAISGLLVFIGGLSILFGIAPGKVGVTCLVVFLLPVTFMMHNYWVETDPMTQLNQRVNFMKNIALLGAALMLLLVPEPWPISLGR
jgi:uncharacterized membrane protein YphA (DoxX/SURF4 family)